MRRIVKWLWIIFVLCVVFFIICDEKWYNFEKKGNDVDFQNGENSDLIDEEELNNSEEIESEPEPIILYKNSNIIRIYRGFENPRSMYKSAGIDAWFVAKVWAPVENRKLDLHAVKLRQWKKIMISKKMLSDYEANGGHLSQEQIQIFSHKPKNFL